MTTYQPELGQLAFGANFHETPLAGHVRAGLARLGALAAPETDSGADPTDNTGASFENAVFSISAFCWCDGEGAGHEEGCPPNFEFAGGPFELNGKPVSIEPLVVDWYKYLGRGSTQSRKVTGSEWAKIEAICAVSIAGSGAKDARTALERALMAVSPWPAAISVEADSAQLFLSLALPAELEPTIETPDLVGIEALVTEAEAAIAAAVAPLGWGPPVILGNDERYWLAAPFPPDFDDSAEARANWRDLDADELDAFLDQNERAPFSDERWTLVRHSAINLRRGLRR